MSLKFSLKYFLVLTLWSIVYGLSSGQLFSATVSGNIRQGNKLYAQDEFDKAVEKYHKALQKSPESAIINFNTGAGYYKSEEYDQSVEHFQKALLAEDQGLRQQAHYNLGNALYRQAEQIGPENPQAAVPFLEKSVAQYEEAIKLDSQDTDAQFNRDFVKKVLEKVKQQVQQQQQQCHNSEERKNSEKRKAQSEKEKNGEEQKNSEERKEQSEEESGAQEPKSTGAQKENQDNEERKGQSGEESGAQEPKSTGAQEENQDNEERKEQSGEQSQNQQQQAADRGQGSGEQEKDLSEREAQMRLRDYENNQEPKGFLNLRGEFDIRPVDKDW